MRARPQYNKSPGVPANSPLKKGRAFPEPRRRFQSPRAPADDDITSTPSSTVPLKKRTPRICSVGLTGLMVNRYWLPVKKTFKAQLPTYNQIRAAFRNPGISEIIAKSEQKVTK